MRTRSTASRANSTASPCRLFDGRGDSSGFFSLFNGPKSANAANNQIQQMRATRPDDVESRAAPLRWPRRRRSRQLKAASVLMALAQVHHQVHYAAAVQQQQQGGGFPSTICSAAINPASPRLSARRCWTSTPTPASFRTVQRAHLRRPLLPDLLRHRAGPVRRRREDLQYFQFLHDARCGCWSAIRQDMNQGGRSPASPTRRCPLRSAIGRR